MLFNSIEYLIFFVVVFLTYWFVLGKSLRLQNIFVLVASYLFYGWWDYRFLFLLVFSTLLDYFTGARIHEATYTRSKKFWLAVSVIANLGFLGFFKYFNFFIDSTATMLNSMGFQANYATLNIILPVGISFYTFHGLSYVFDIYNRKIEPVKNIIDYSLFVSFFPLLVAGPIERATHLLPQLQRKRIFTNVKAVDGLRQILWGLFKKIVIADNCAFYVNTIFDNYQSQSGSTLVLGAVLFAFQIYCDFSGYSDIALGSARLLGIELLRNFAFPYFSRDIAEFWRRWHISLSSWFRDYLYVPLGGSKGTKFQTIRNTFIIFLVSGFWHGANWTFIVWGLLHAIFFLPLLLFKRNRKNLDIVAEGKLMPSLREALAMLVTFTVVVLGWIVFRAESLTHAWNYITGIFTASLFSTPSIDSVPLMLLIMMFVVVEWLGRHKAHPLSEMNIRISKPLRWAVYYGIISLIVMYAGKEQEFIYFQF